MIPKKNKCDISKIKNKKRYCISCVKKCEVDTTGRCRLCGFNIKFHKN